MACAKSAVVIRAQLVGFIVAPTTIPVARHAIIIGIPTTTPPWPVPHMIWSRLAKILERVGVGSSLVIAAGFWDLVVTSTLNAAEAHNCGKVISVR